jgi:23S rRNA (guanosine2251-2'-O)-methyltransferase
MSDFLRKRPMYELETLAMRYRNNYTLPEVILVADNLRSALNVGSLFRSADALGAKALWLCGISARPPHREILKTALGASDWVPWHYEQEVTRAALLLIEQGYHLMGLEQAKGATPLHLWSPPDQPIALFVGNEVHGLSDDLLPLLHGCIEIPQFGQKHSLNVTVAAGIALWDILRQRL